MSTTFTSWIEWITHQGTALAVVLGVFGALLGHTIASHLRFANGFRFVAASAGFAALFLAGQSTFGQRNTTADSDVTASQGNAPKGLRARARALIDRVPRDLTLANARQEIISFAAGFTTPPLRHFAGVASDTTAHELAGFFADALLDLRRDSVACVSFLFGVMDSNLPPELSTELEGRHYRLAGRIAKEGRETPEVPVDSVAAIPLGKEMALGLWRKHGERAERMLELMSDPANAMSKPRQVCSAGIAVYSSIEQMPRSRGGRLMRYMLHRRPGERNRGSLSPETPLVQR